MKSDEQVRAEVKQAYQDWEARYGDLYDLGVSAGADGDLDTAWLALLLCEDLPAEDE